MSRNTLLYLLGIAVAIAVIAIFTVYLLNQKKAEMEVTQRQTPPVPESSQTPLAQIVPEAQIEITKAGFVPAVIKIKPRTQVRWINNDNILHRVSSDPHPTHTNLPDLDSEEPLNIDDSFTYIFETPGTYTYHDHLNPLKFKGTVIVE